MRFVLAPQGTLGDVRPLVALGIALRESGHQVVFGAPPNHRDWIENLGLEFHPVGLDMDAPSEEADRAMGNPVRTLVSGLRFMQSLVPSQFRGLEPLLDKSDMLIGSGLEFAGRSLAEKYRIPYRYVCHVPSAVRSRFHPPLAVPYRVFPSWVNQLLWWANSLGLACTFGRGIQSERKRLGLAPVSNLAEFVSRDVVLAADEALAPVPSDCRLAFRTGYLELDEAPVLPEALEAFLANGPPPVFVGFGSMRDPNPKKTLQFLQQMTRATRIVVSSRWAQSRAISDNPNIHFVASVPHAALFRRVAVVVHHGGAGTTHTAARIGVPQIIVPHMVDQYYWAHRVHSLGLGPQPIRRAHLSPSTLETALTQVRPGSTIQEAAKAFALRLVESATRSRGELLDYLKITP